MRSSVWSPYLAYVLSPISSQPHGITVVSCRYCTDVRGQMDLSNAGVCDCITLQLFESSAKTRRSLC